MLGTAQAAPGRVLLSGKPLKPEARTKTHSCTAGRMESQNLRRFSALRGQWGGGVGPLQTVLGSLLQLTAGVWWGGFILVLLEDPLVPAQSCSLALCLLLPPALITARERRVLGRAVAGGRSGCSVCAASEGLCRALPAPWRPPAFASGHRGQSWGSSAGPSKRWWVVVLTGTCVCVRVCVRVCGFLCVFI